MEYLDPAEFLEAARAIPLADVRAPAEYAEGHVCGAHSLPLFDDAERAEIGALYKRSGRDSALRRGREFADPKRETYLEAAHRLAPERRIALYCWRGGLRSAKLAELFQQADFQCTLLRGGYKAYRAHIRERFAAQDRLVILGGATGSGKTELLHELAARGEQVVDLEGLAHHRGSAFGALGMPPQPSTEQFHNRVFEALRACDPARRIWLESESKTIGKAYLPEELWTAMKRSPLIAIALPEDIRLRRLSEEYGRFPREDLAACVRRIERRFGPEKVKICLELLRQNRIEDVARELLGYYDASYLNSRRKHHRHAVRELRLHGEELDGWAEQLIAAAPP